MLSTALSLLLGIGSASAITIPLHRRAPPHSTLVRISPTTNVTGDDPFGFQSVDGNGYTGTIFLSGEPFIVQLDTGSSDLWLDTANYTLSGLTDTGIPGSVKYVDGSGAWGNINLGSISWGDFTIRNQAFINAPGANASYQQYQGLLGVGPPPLSRIEAALNNSQYDGSSFLDNVFSYYPNEPNFMTFLLSRSDFGVVDGGVFTIGELVPNLTAINDTPQLEVVTADSWSTFMDGIWINGTFYNGGSLPGSLVTPPTGKTLAILDTGSALVSAPKAYVDAMYAGIPGVEFMDDAFYVFPCDTKLNVSVVFGNMSYPIDPLDLAIPFLLSDDRQKIGCVGTFTYATESSGFDVILGDRFLRNVYSLFDFGHWARVGDNNPFIQILSTTDIQKAWDSFDSLNEARLQGFLAQRNSTSSPPSLSSSVSASGSASPSILPSPSSPSSSILSFVTPTPLSSQSPSIITVASSSLPSGIITAGSSSAGTTSPSSISTDKDLQIHAASLNGNDNSTPDWNTLARNSYIIMGLLAGVIVLLLGLVIKTCFSGRTGGGLGGGKGYKALKDPYPPQHDRPYTSEAYTTPYADGGH